MRNWLTCVLPELVDVVVLVVGVEVAVVVVATAGVAVVAAAAVTGVPRGGTHPQSEGGKGPWVGLNFS